MGQKLPPIVVAFLLIVVAAGHTEPPIYDLIFSGGRVVDGTGAPWFRAEVGVIRDRIVAVGDLSRSAARRRINAKRFHAQKAVSEVL